MIWTYLCVFLVITAISGLIECDSLDGFYFSWKNFFKGCAIGSVGGFLIVGILSWMYGSSI